MSDEQQAPPKEVKAYRRFWREAREITHDFTARASDILRDIDKKKAEDIKRKIHEI